MPFQCDYTFFELQSSNFLLAFSTPVVFLVVVELKRSQGGENCPLSKIVANRLSSQFQKVINSQTVVYHYFLERFFTLMLATIQKKQSTF